MTDYGTADLELGPDWNGCQDCLLVRVARLHHCECVMMLTNLACPDGTMPLHSPTAGLADFLAAHNSLLARLHARAGADRWGVSREEFAVALYRSAAKSFAGAPPASEALEMHLHALHLEDLALACALRKGSEQAWEEFVARYRPILYAASRAIVGSAGEARARELADSLYADLYALGAASDPQRRSLLDYFHGRSKLATWLRAVLAQRHVDALRSAKRVDPLEDEEAQRPVAVGRGNETPAGDPDRARLLPRLQQSMGAALAALAASDRLLLSLYYVQELTLAQVARLRGVHEATISRQLERIRCELREEVARSLGAVRTEPDGRAGTAGLSPAEIELCFGYALDDWAFDLGRALSDGSRNGSKR
jgi:RNA polymerase sigma factor (sigma-70 family)